MHMYMHIYISTWAMSLSCHHTQERMYIYTHIDPNIYTYICINMYTHDLLCNETYVHVSQKIMSLSCHHTQERMHI